MTTQNEAEGPKDSEVRLRFEIDDVWVTNDVAEAIESLKQNLKRSDSFLQFDWIIHMREGRGDATREYDYRIKTPIRVIDSTKSECTQCGEQHSIIAIREVCRDCHKRDMKLMDAEEELYAAVKQIPSMQMAHWPRVSDALKRLEEFYS